MYIMKMPLGCITIGFHQKYQQSYGPDQLATIAENISASTRINNDILFGNIDAMGRTFERAKQHTEELSRINVNNAKTIANSARDTAVEFSNNREVYR